MSLISRNVTSDDYVLYYSVSNGIMRVSHNRKCEKLGGEKKY